MAYVRDEGACRWAIVLIAIQVRSAVSTQGADGLMAQRAWLQLANAVEAGLARAERDKNEEKVSLFKRYASSMVNQSDVAIYGIEVDGNLTDMTRRRRAPRAS